MAHLVAVVGIPNFGFASAGERFEMPVIRYVLRAVNSEILPLTLGSSLLVDMGVAVLVSLSMIEAATLGVPATLGKSGLMETLDILVLTL